MKQIDDRAAHRAISKSFVESNDSLRTTITNAEVDINVSAFTDSIAIADDAGNKVTTTLIGSKRSLDVNVTDITISHANDSIRLGDGTDLNTISTVGAKKGLDVNVINNTNTVIAPAGATILLYGTISNLGIGSSSNAVNYIASGTDKYVQKIYFSGTQVGTATVYKNGSPLLKIRLSPATFTQVLDLATGSAFGTLLEPGDSLVIEVTNNGNALADFDATLQYLET